MAYYTDTSNVLIVQSSSYCNATLRGKQI